MNESTSGAHYSVIECNPLNFAFHKYILQESINIEFLVVNKYELIPKTIIPQNCHIWNTSIFLYITARKTEKIEQFGKKQRKRTKPQLVTQQLK